MYTYKVLRILYLLDVSLHSYDIYTAMRFNVTQHTAVEELLLDISFNDDVASSSIQQPEVFYV